MIEVFETEPDWSRYNLKSVRTQALHRYWATKNLGGGSLIDSVSTSIVQKIYTPLKNMILDTENYGYFEIKKFKDSKKG